MPGRGGSDVPVGGLGSETIVPSQVRCPSTVVTGDVFAMVRISSWRYSWVSEILVLLAIPVISTRSPTAYSVPSMVILSSDSRCPPYVRM